MEQSSQEPPIGEGGNTQPNNPTQAPTAADSIPPIPPKSKKRKANANGPRKTSAAWEHFIVLPESEVKEPTAACKYCGHRYLCDPKIYGTTNMLNHIARLCPKYPGRLSQDPNQTVLTFGPGKGGENSALVPASLRFDVKACRKALATFVIVDEQPFRVVEGEGFKHLCKQLQPQFTVVSRHTVARDCFQLYLDEKKRLKAFFKSNCTRVALTSDCWTSIQNLNYLALTAHFIDNDWNYQKRIISFSLVANHKGESIGKQIEDSLKEWGLRNISTITLDNATSNDVAVSYLKKKFKNMGGLVLDGEFFHMRCCAHILNLVVNDGLREVNNSITSIRNAVRFVRSSPQRLAKFRECIEFANILSNKLVPLDVPTRWNSTYTMLEAAEKFQLAFDKLEFEDSSYLDYFGAAGPPSSEDWVNARSLVNFLKIFYDATKVFSASLHVTIHTAFHQLAIVSSEIRKSSIDKNSDVRVRGVEMKKKYDKYWGNALNINQLLYFGVILDPRFKMKYIEWSFFDMYKSDHVFANKLYHSVKENLTRMYNWYAAAQGQQYKQDQSVAGQLDSNGETTPHAEISTLLARRDAFRAHLEAQSCIDKKNELETYLAEANVHADDKFQLLLWWKQNSSRFPILSTMAKDVFATPVSTVASESVFSTGGRVLDTFRSSLTSEMAEALICCQNWLKPSLLQFKGVNPSEELENSETIVTEFQRKVAGSQGTRVLPSRDGIVDGGIGSTSSQSQPVTAG